MMRNEAYQTLRLGIPIIIGELAQMSLNIIDAAMIGAISYKQLAAAALVLSAMNIPFVLGMGMTISMSQMVSMAHGRNDDNKVSHYLFNGFLVCSLTAIMISVCMVWGRGVILHLGQDPEVARLALPFMTLIGISVIPMLLFMTLKQFTDGLEFTRTAMVLSVSGLPVNAFLNWVLIYGHLGFQRMELVGAGIATLITRSLMFIALALVVLLHPTFRKYMLTRKAQWVFRRRTIRELLRIGVPSSLQMGMEAGAFSVSGIIIGTLGAVAQAAHQIALTCAAFTFMVSMGLAQAGSIRVSNAFGGSNWLKISLIGKSTLVTALMYGTCCAIFFIAFRQALPLVFNNNPEVVSATAVLLMFAAVFQIPDSTQAIGAGLLRGIKDVKVPTLLVGIAYWVIGIPVGYLFAFYFGMGARGMWLGLTLGLAMSSLFLIARFLSSTKKRLQLQV